MLKLRALLFREDEQTVAVCLEHFVVGQGANAMEAIESLALCLKGHDVIGGLSSVSTAPNKYQKSYDASVRESTTAREGFIFQVRTV